MRSACVLALFAAVSLTVGATGAVADPGGNSGAAHACKQTPGKNTGDCVSDAAHGGTVTPPTSASQPVVGAAAPTSAARPAGGAAPPATAGANSKAAHAGGNSKAAHQCQKGGWRNWRRADQTSFKNAGACVSYAAHGGTLTAPKSAAQLLCESFGGVFAAGSGNKLWLCTYNIAVDTGRFFALADQCFADGGFQFGFVSGNVSGLRTDACFG
jgi:hypothetical protein